MNDEILDGTILDPEPPNPTLDMVKKIADIVVFTSVGTTVGLVIDAAIPEDLSWFKRKSVKVGAWFLGGYVSGKIAERVEGFIDDVHRGMQEATATLHNDTPAG